MKIITKNSEETKKLGEEFALRLHPGDVVLLYGDLGAGKTTFVQALAMGLGIHDRILSPTFVLERSYAVANSKIKNLNHIDLYRIENKGKLENLGLSEVMTESESVSVIEWADRLDNFELKKGYKVYISYLGDNEREINIEKYE